MIITSQGFGHFTQGLNNQDFGIETPRMLLVLDGCSGAKYSEIGTRLFAQLFSRKEECDKLENFEDNVKEIFDNLIDTMEKYYPTRESMINDFIMENLLFTIIACFETDDKYIVKLFGDGYIVTENKQGCISYIKFSYGKCPPYYAYKYCDMNYENHNFKTFCFDKERFSKVAIASDGILPFVKGDIQDIDKLISEGKRISIEAAIKLQKQSFFDDVTIGMFERGDNNGNI